MTFTSTKTPSDATVSWESTIITPAGPVTASLTDVFNLALTAPSTLGVWQQTQSIEIRFTEKVSGLSETRVISLTVCNCTPLTSTLTWTPNDVSVSRLGPANTISLALTQLSNVCGSYTIPTFCNATPGVTCTPNTFSNLALGSTFSFTVSATSLDATIDPNPLNLALTLQRTADTSQHHVFNIPVTVTPCVVTALSSANIQTEYTFRLFEDNQSFQIPNISPT
jgi:hypothetical protein